MLVMDEVSTKAAYGVRVRFCPEDFGKSVLNNRWLQSLLYMWSSDFTVSTNAKLLSLDVVGGVLAFSSLALLSLPSCDWAEQS